MKVHTSDKKRMLFFVLFSLIRIFADRMKQKVTIYPYIAYPKGEKANPYIYDFAAAVNATGEAMTLNEPSRNPLLSILPFKRWGDITVFNWFESIPDYIYGPLQATVAIFYTLLLKCTGRQIIWILHNKKPHVTRYQWLKKLLTWYITHMADLIVTHSTEGIRLLKEQYPYAVNKAHYISHPTKDRTSDQTASKKYDLVVWGAITPYKGIVELLEYLNRHSEFQPTLCIAGHCANQTLKARIQLLLRPGIDFIPEAMPFDTLQTLIAQSRYVLMPYQPETILSSGILMDSLSFGAKIIGPNVGSFHDYSQEPLLKVYTFNTFDDLPAIMEQHKDEEPSLTDYRSFLHQHDWNHFAHQILSLANNPTK